MHTKETLNTYGRVVNKSKATDWNANIVQNIQQDIVHELDKLSDPKCLTDRKLKLVFTVF